MSYIYHMSQDMTFYIHYTHTILGSVHVLYKHVWGGGGSDQKCLFAYGVRGGWGVLRQNAYITDLNSYSPEKGL